MPKRFIIPSRNAKLTKFSWMTNLVSFFSLFIMFAVGDFFSVQNAWPLLLPASVFVLCLLTQHSFYCRVAYFVYAAAVLMFASWILVKSGFTQRVLLPTFLIILYGLMTIGFGVVNFRKHRPQL